MKTIEMESIRQGFNFFLNACVYAWIWFWPDSNLRIGFRWDTKKRNAWGTNGGLIYEFILMPFWVAKNHFVWHEYAWWSQPFLAPFTHILNERASKKWDNSLLSSRCPQRKNARCDSLLIRLNFHEKKIQPEAFGVVLRWGLTCNPMLFWCL